MSWAAIAASVAGAALSAGVAAASAPSYTSPAKSSRKAVMASLRALPGQRQAEAAARLGVPVEYAADNWMRPRDAYKAGLITKEELAYFRKLNEETGLGVLGDLYPGTEPLSTGPQKDKNQDERNGKRRGYHVRMKNDHMEINIGRRQADFTGYGDADIQGALARQMAEGQLELQKKYGVEFAQEAARQQEMADPEGAAARRLLAKTITDAEQARQNRERPVAEMLDSQIQSEMEAGRNVSGDAIAKVLGQREGLTIGAGDIAATLADGPEGDQRIAERMQKALSFYGSGAAPEDAEYRERQQSLANMAAFLAGRTPQSQFSSLSGAQRGAAPMPQAPGLPGVQSNITQMGNAAGLANFQQGVQHSAGNVSPYFAGLSALISGAQTAGAAGYQPFRRN